MLITTKPLVMAFELFVFVGSGIIFFCTFFFLIYLVRIA